MSPNRGSAGNRIHYYFYPKFAERLHVPLKHPGGTSGRYASPNRRAKRVNVPLEPIEQGLSLSANFGLVLVYEHLVSWAGNGVSEGLSTPGQV